MESCCKIQKEEGSLRAEVTGRSLKGYIAEYEKQELSESRYGEERERCVNLWLTGINLAKQRSSSAFQDINAWKGYQQIHRPNLISQGSSNIPIKYIYRKKESKKYLEDDEVINPQKQLNW